MDKIDLLMQEMIVFYEGSPKHIGHFAKVHSYARLIGKMEGINPHMQMVLEAAALVHDIGIKPAEEKFGSSAGHLQEQEGPAPAGEMLRRVGFSEDVIERVCYLVGHHHTYTDIDGLDYQILVEADFLVNLYEDAVDQDTVRSVCKKIFKTASGLELIKKMYRF